MKEIIENFILMKFLSFFSTFPSVRTDWSRMVNTQLGVTHLRQDGAVTSMIKVLSNISQFRFDNFEKAKNKN